MPGTDVIFIQHQKKSFKIRALKLLFYGAIKMLPLVIGNKKAIIKKNPVNFKNLLFFFFNY